VIYYVTLLAHGDNLISLSLLTKLKDKENIKIIGTSLTQSIAEFIPDLNIPIIRVSENIPAYFDVRKRGWLSAMREGFNFIMNFSRHLNTEDVILFENRGFRLKLLSAYFTRNIYEPRHTGNVYEDRRDLLEAVFNEQVPLREVTARDSLPECVTINPASRVKEKAIPSHVIGHVISYLKRNRIYVRLVDPEKEYFELRNLVDSYHVGTSLHQAAELVRDSDFYIGADSLFIHFAYYYDVPFLVLFNKSNLYFAPPGVEKLKNYIESVSHISKKEFYPALDCIFAGIQGARHH
jgi:ADP-heptose:LPS heptosyltransferase